MGYINHWKTRMARTGPRLENYFKKLQNQFIWSILFKKVDLRNSVRKILHKNSEYSVHFFLTLLSLVSAKRSYILKQNLQLKAEGSLCMYDLLVGTRY